MTTRFAEYAYFVRLLDALEPLRDQIVIIGGWAHRLYRLHPLSQDLNFPPLTTLDTDVALPENLVFKERSLRDRLAANGFAEEFLGTDRPPAAHYTLGKEFGGFYAEFLSPLTGGVNNRGKVTATVRVAGVSAQKLRYLDLLLHKPWRVELSESAGFPLARSTTVQIPNAASYLAQKLLIHDRRHPAERAKHIVYIHDTVLTFGRSLPQVRIEWRDNVRSLLPKKTAEKIGRSVEELFREVTDTIRNASIEANATGRVVSAAEIRAVCHAGLKQIFT